jgi:transcriptional regulator GlxA family with amidase domain
MLTATAGSFSAEVRRYLGTQIDREYDLTALASAHHVSTRTLLRRFRSETGQTPLNCLQSLCISQARRALETTDLSVEEVAHNVGYTDTSTFRRLFARTVGMSPSEYRRSFSKVGGRSALDSASAAEPVRPLEVGPQRFGS